MKGTTDSMKRISIVYSDCYLDHETGSHVENPGRIKAIQRALTTAPWSDQLDWIQPRRASVDEIAMIHDRDYIEYIRRSCETARGITYLNPDTAISPDSYEVALQAAGGVFEGIDRVVSDSAAGFFALVRPPGHHAEANEALGFCIFNNIAIGAKYAQLTHGLKKVFILDWDVHHGNGTQHSLYEDPTVFFASFHQYPYYPGTGGMTEMGKDKGLGFTMNFPMRARSTDDDYMLLMEECVFPAIKKFQPDLLLISAGFDAHRDDPLGAILLTESCYGAML
ncbi:MAG TPA: histone deacetylase, partial [bacterium]|nr:histone deacetylase [bacterium]